MRRITAAEGWKAIESYQISFSLVLMNNYVHPAVMHANQHLIFPNIRNRLLPLKGCFSSRGFLFRIGSYREIFIRELSALYKQL